MDGQAINEIERPRSAWQLINAALDLYGRYPVLFLILASAVVVPFQATVLIITGTGPLAQRELGFGASTLLDATNLFLINPLISALHVHGVLDVREGDSPRLGPIARRSLVALPVVSAAVIISWLGILLGFFALIIPGFLLTLRWAMVPQAAALEGNSWIDALRRSRELTRTHYAHIFGVLLLAGLIDGVPLYLVGRAFGHSSTTAASFIVGTGLLVLLRSFTALVTAMLFFDLSARLSQARAKPPPSPNDRSPTGDPLDPASWADEDRPRG